jgi:hypothetical protein
MPEAMKERGAGRRQLRAWFASPVNDRRRPQYERRVGATAARGMPGTVRPGFGEAVPHDERRRVPGGGME